MVADLYIAGIASKNISQKDSSKKMNILGLTFFTKIFFIFLIKID
jgi:hypothetical protein